eukprot:1002923-Pelagomonas_calceolata.AAC.3
MTAFLRCSRGMGLTAFPISLQDLHVLAQQVSGDAAEARFWKHLPSTLQAVVELRDALAMVSAPCFEADMEGFCKARPAALILEQRRWGLLQDVFRCAVQKRVKGKAASASHPTDHCGGVGLQDTSVELRVKPTGKKAGN